MLLEPLPSPLSTPRMHLELVWGLVRGEQSGEISIQRELQVLGGCLVKVDVSDGYGGL